MPVFLPYIHFLRGVAILYVISVHVRGFQSYWRSSPEVYRIFDTFSDPSEGNGTTLFLFIGGFLFQHLTQKYFNFKKYLNQKFKVLIMPYLIISIPLILYRLNTNFESLFLPENFQDRPAVFQVLHFLMTGSHLPPFWFISTIILFYFTAPLLHALDRDKFYKYIFPFILLACLFTYRPEHNANPFLSYLHFIPVYMLGMCASYYKDSILSDDRRVFSVLLFVYGGLCVGEIGGWISLSRNLSFEDVLNQQILVFNIYLFKALILCFTLLMLFYHLRDKQIPILEQIGNYSFGLFFVHYFFISMSRKIFLLLHYSPDFSLLTYLIYFLGILMVSMAAVYAVKKATGRYSRYLIGS